eukprot:m.413134 g.413134  ORF g.413134 m.413134 type:complete len:338 (+) comp20172_c5_seq8:92-1105(+)
MSVASASVLVRARVAEHWLGRCGGLQKIKARWPLTRCPGRQRRALHKQQQQQQHPQQKLQHVPTLPVAGQRWGGGWRQHHRLRRLHATNTEGNDSNHQPTPTPKRRVQENIFTIPNLLTLGRLTATPFLGHLIVSKQYPAALGLFMVAGVSDWLDGFIARRYKTQSSVLGAVIDPVADKFLIVTLTVCLAQAQLLPLPLAALFVARDASFLASACFIRYKSLRLQGLATVPLKTYFAFDRPTVQVTPTTASKANTALQLGLFGLILVNSAVDQTLIPDTALWYLCCITGATTVGSSVQYLFSKDAIRYLPADSASNTAANDQPDVTTARKTSGSSHR